MDIKKKNKKHLSPATSNHQKSSGLLVDNTDEMFSGGIIIDFFNKQIR